MLTTEQSEALLKELFRHIDKDAIEINFCENPLSCCMFIDISDQLNMRIRTELFVRIAVEMGFDEWVSNKLAEDVGKNFLDMLRGGVDVPDSIH